jgi:hypothetical protein
MQHTTLPSSLFGMAALGIVMWVLFCTEKRKRKNYAGSEKPLPTLIKENEPFWYRVP